MQPDLDGFIVLASRVGAVDFVENPLRPGRSRRCRRQGPVSADIRTRSQPIRHVGGGHAVSATHAYILRELGQCELGFFVDIVRTAICEAPHDDSEIGFPAGYVWFGPTDARVEAAINLIFSLKSWR